MYKLIGRIDKTIVNNWRKFPMSTNRLQKSLISDFIFPIKYYQSMTNLLHYHDSEVILINISEIMSLCHVILQYKTYYRVVTTASFVYRAAPVPRYKKEMQQPKSRQFSFNHSLWFVCSVSTDSSCVRSVCLFLCFQCSSHISFLVH